MWVVLGVFFIRCKLLELIMFFRQLRDRITNYIILSVVFGFDTFFDKPFVGVSVLAGAAIIHYKISINSEYIASKLLYQN